MKRFIFFAHVCTCFAFTCPIAVCAQSAGTFHPNYVVIGAFAVRENALHFTDEAKRGKLPARFEMNLNRNLYYVYVLSTTDKEYAVAEALKLRAQTKYFDTWVYSGAFDIMDHAGSSEVGAEDIDPVTGKKLERVQGEQNQLTESSLTLTDASTQVQRQQGDKQSGRNSSPTDTDLNDQLADGSTLQANLPNNNNDTGRAGGKKDVKPGSVSDGNASKDQSTDDLATGTTDQTRLYDVSETSLQYDKSNSPVRKNRSAQKTHKDRVIQSSQQGQSQSPDGQTGKDGNNQQNALAEKSSNNTVVKSPEQSRSHLSERESVRTDQENNQAQTTDKNSGLRSSQQIQQRSEAGQNQQQGTTAGASAQKLDGQQTTLSAKTSAQRQENSVSQEQGTSQMQGRKDVQRSPVNAPQTASAQKNKLPADKSTIASNEQSSESKNKTVTENTTLNDDTEKRPVSVKNGSLVADASRTVAREDKLTDPIPPPVRQSTAPLTSEEVTGKDFYFHLYRADNLNTIPGEVDAIDFEKSRKMATYPANEGVKVIMPSGKTKHISFVCQVFGYRKQQQEFNPSAPAEDLYLDDKGNLVIPFELVRLQKGDIAIMYNVFFFKDAAVMRPESRYEVNNLLELLEENPSYKIRIHGHTNGNASGKIIRMDNDGNFYSLAGTKQGFGSAKQLSEERALVIREFLISSGINAERMDIKAWGGKKPIHDKHSARAHENVRVEIEILSQ